MYIKQMTIQGFKSYRDQTVVEPFSPNHNVVVGRNGSGKSNFFLAIRFVLSDMFSNMRSEERQALLHEGTGASVMSAYVEIVFDNSDSRIPIEREEVVLRRTIGVKKDEYFLDRKHVTKNDVMNLLESAGFSRSNPYYIVQQGKINSLALAKDAERLQLLKEVAGTSTYDERREESMRIMAETQSKREKIDDALKYIEQRISELDEEKDELQRYQVLDKDRRSLEYTIYDRELKTTRDELDAIESKRLTGSEQKARDHMAAQKDTDAIKTMEAHLKALSTEAQAKQHERKQLNEEAQQLAKQRAKLDITVRELEEDLQDDKGKKNKIQKEIAHLDGQITARKRELEQVMPMFEAEAKKERQMNDRMGECERRRGDLYARSGRSVQFHTVAERDAWINKEVKSISGVLAEKKKQTKSLSSEVADLKRKVEQRSKDITARTDLMETRRTEIDVVTAEITKFKAKREELTTLRKETWRRDADMDSSIELLKSEHQKAEKTLHGSMPRHIAIGLQTIDRLAREHKIGGVYGPLIDLFDCEEITFIAVEVTAGTSLFHIVVDTDDTASRLLELMNREKTGGRVTFMPLNRIQTPNVNFEKHTESDAVPLIEKLSYQPMFHPAMAQIFGKTLLCRSMDYAAHVSRTQDVDCVTVEGDQVSRKGSLTGGYHDARKLRLQSNRQRLKLKEQLNAALEESRKLKAQASEAETQVNMVMTDIQRAETRCASLKGSFEQLRIELRSHTSERDGAAASLDNKDRLLEKLVADSAALEQQVKSLQSELGTELSQHMSAQEQAEVSALTNEIAEIRRSLVEVLRTKAESEARKTELEQLLKNNLEKRREELASMLEDPDTNDRVGLHESRRSELKSLIAQEENARGRLESLEGRIAQIESEVRAVKQTLEDKRAEQRGLAERLEKEGKDMDKLLNKRSLVLQKKDEYVRKIRELGALPADAFEKYKDLDLQTLYKKLHKCNEGLKKYSHVNKKALDQYMSFSEQREDLLKRKRELDEGDRAIHELIQTLDQRKDEAIERTFKQVAKYFSEVFQELVPAGRGSLIMQRKQDEAESESAKGKGPAVRGGRVEQYTGIAIKVSFTSKTGDILLMQQLSGGQKSLVALAMIFAIQRCDPAPFYLFDEIDQALDAAHRTAVAEMIHRMCSSAQFITTTFRPEMLAHADKCYGIIYRNKISTVECVDKQQALQFIEDEARETHGQPVQPSQIAPSQIASQV